MTYDPAQAVANARGKLGYHEGDNNANMFTAWQTGYSGAAWCDSFACWCAYNAGYRFPPYSLWGERGDWNVGTHHQHAITEGTWRDRAHRASGGDLVVLSWDVPDQHIEVVLADDGTNVATIGGNVANQVLAAVRFRPNIVGFIALTQSSQTAKPAPPAAPKPKWRRKMLTFYTVPDHPNEAARGTVWMSDGFTARGMHNPEELGAWRFIAAADGAPHTDVGQLPYGVHIHLLGAH